MRIPPSYKLTPEIISLISRIEALKEVFKTVTIPAVLKEKIQRVSILKSSLYSARIEGNELTIEEVEGTQFSAGPGEEYNKKEIFNILRASAYIDKNLKSGNVLSSDFILCLHRLVLDGLSPDAGHFRHETGAIFNSAGVAVYLSPPPKDISGLINQLLEFINSSRTEFPLIDAFISHLVFEKIHPFIDGNGRVGRILISSILKIKGWEFTLAIPLEEYIENHKEDYYYSLDKGIQVPEDYIIYMLTAFYEQAQKIKEELDRETAKKEPLYLPPRQEEIYLLIKDHRLVSIDFISRRFLKVPVRTLRFDLEKLVKRGLVVKIGKTRGSYYSLKS